MHEKQNTYFMHVCRIGNINLQFINNLKICLNNSIFNSINIPVLLKSEPTLVLIVVMASKSLKICEL